MRCAYGRMMPRHRITTTTLRRAIESERDAERARRWAVMSARFMQTDTKVADSDASPAELSTAS